MNTREAAATAGRGIGYYLLILLGVVGAFGIVALVWWLSVAASGTAGSGNVTRDQNSAANRERWSATYNNDMQQVQADQTNLAVLKAAATGPGATQQDRQDYLGLQLNCRTDVATYNTDAANVLGAQWLPAGFPSSLDSSDYCGK